MDDRRKTRIVRLLLPALLILATAAISLTQWPSMVPSVEGLTTEAAVEAMAQANLSLVQQGEEYNADVPRGAIIRQDTSAGSVVDRQHSVGIIVSLGPSPVQVPDLTGLLPEAATKLLGESGLGYQEGRSTPDEEIPKGYVKNQQPSAGETLLEGQKVIVTLSSGPQYYDLPDVTLQDEKEATATLNGVGFVEISSFYVYSPQPQGTVLEQTPASSSRILADTNIVLKVSKGQGNREGNTAGNINNGGLLTYQDGWIYFANPSDGYKLYKMRENGTGLTLLSDVQADFINVKAETIYFRNVTDNGRIYSVSTEGGTPAPLGSDMVYYLRLVDGIFYYKNLSDGGKIYSMKMDGTGRKALNKVNSEFVTVASDGYIYFSNGSRYSHLCRIPLQGGDVEELCNYTSKNPAEIKGNMYFLLMKNTRFYLYSLKNGRIKQLAGPDFTDLNAGEDGFYAADPQEARSLYRIDLNGESIKISEDRCGFIHIINGTIYYQNLSDGLLYSILPDGSGKAPVGAK